MMEHAPATRYDPYADPVLHVGVDIGYARDTLGLACVFAHRHVTGDVWYGLWGHRLWVPGKGKEKQIRINQTVVPMLNWLIDNTRIAQILYDPYQFKSEAQRLEDAGHARLLTEVNQSSQSVAFSNTLHEHINSGTFYTYTNPQIRSHFSWTNAQETERGWRIVKMKQSRPIDAVVAIAMALMGAVQDTGGVQHQGYSADNRDVELEVLP